MDYKELLIKYIRHLERQEGATYTYSGDVDPTLFTGPEWTELERLGEEALQREYTSRRNP